VTDLIQARTKDKEEPDLVGKVGALRKLLESAKETRQACDAVFEDKFLRDSLKIPLITGVIRKMEASNTSEGDIGILIKYLLSIDYFLEFGNKFVIYLDRVIKSTSHMVAVMADAARIRDCADYLFTMWLAHQWLTIFGQHPTSINFDNPDEGTTFKPTFFQDFVRTLPLDEAIKGETVRTVVACIQEWSPKESRG